MGGTEGTKVTPCGLHKEQIEGIRTALGELLASEWEVVEGPNDFKLKKKGDPASAGKIASVPKRDGRDEFQRRIAEVLVATPWMLAVLDDILSFLDNDGVTIKDAIAMVGRVDAYRHRVEEIKGGA